jgi:pSer/pThr/pTyr-binding forkhead associated (FHA) protein
MTEISNLDLLALNDLPIVGQSIESELESRLSLYQVFLKLYDHKKDLLDEILQLEDSYHPSFRGVKLYYLQGVIDNSKIYVTTNLCEGKTETLQQSQGVWTIGRDRTSGIYIADRYVSRRHAAIQYIDNQGFYFIDFNSTNGSYINGELVLEPRKLEEGDRVRVGNTTFCFFMNHDYRILPTVAMELLMQLVPETTKLEVTSQMSSKTYLIESDQTERMFQKVVFDRQSAYYANLDPQKQAEILDNFYNKRMP